jgi:hypothetical protein
MRAVVEEAHVLVRERVDDITAVRRLRSAADGDQKVLEGATSCNRGRDQEALDAHRLLAMAIHGERDPEFFLSREELALLELPPDQAFATLAIHEPRLVNLEDAIRSGAPLGGPRPQGLLSSMMRHLPDAKDPEGAAKLVALSQINQRVGQLVGPDAQGKQGLLAGHVAMKVAMVHLAGVAGFPLEGHR